MLLPVLALIVGLVIGTIFTVPLPVIYAKYLSIAVLAGLDSLLGGWRAVMDDNFDSGILVSGFFLNALLAALLAYLGDMLGLDLYLAAVIAFGIRIFSNLGYMRRAAIERWRHNNALKHVQKIALKMEKDGYYMPKSTPSSPPAYPPETPINNPAENISQTNNSSY